MGTNTWQSNLQQTINDIIGYEPEKIILYGSAARGEFTEQSDIDLLIIKKTDKDIFDRIGEVLKLLRNNPLPVEPIVLTPEEFQKMQFEERLFAEVILREGKILYEK
ncbi:MAG: nucleotidyltransferase domain-containing protein [Elusimicrobiota bacterium]